MTTTHTTKKPYYDAYGQPCKRVIIDHNTTPGDLFKVSEVHEIALTYKRIPMYHNRGDGSNTNRIHRSADAVNIIRDSYRSSGREISDVESFGVMFLNRANYCYAIQFIGQGGLTGTVSDPRVIFSAALLMRAAGLILFHNHPSGLARPSQPDVEITKNCEGIGKILQVAVLDHVIVTENDGHYSFADDGIL